VEAEGKDDYGNRVTRRISLERVPLESAEPLRGFAALRVALSLAGLIGGLVFEMPHAGRLAVVAGLVALPWSAGLWTAARRAPEAPLSPIVPVLDIAILALVELVTPSTYTTVRVVAVVLVAAHAAVHGEQRGLAVALLAIVVLVPISDAHGAPLAGGVLAFSEVLFAVAAVAIGLFIGRLRAAESTGRLRARELSRRAIEAENQVRRRVAESIHDGPVQELVSLDMMLEAARRAVARGDSERAQATLEGARRLTERNVGALREEIIGLGPYAFDELSLDAALDQCVPIWSRRYDFSVETSFERLELPPDACGALFGIAQEAVANAGRHSGASSVTLALRAVGGHVELTVGDDGHGFRGAPPLATGEPGHIGLASMRERAEALGGTLEIESTERGTTVAARIPLPAGSAEAHTGQVAPTPIG
jgi:signal transduction histidine kinase